MLILKFKGLKLTTKTLNTYIPVGWFKLLIGWKVPIEIAVPIKIKVPIKLK
jgi:hypothetical protein